MDKRLFLTIVVFFAFTAIYAQDEFVMNDTLKLQSITITGTRLNDFTSGHRLEVVDSMILQNYQSANLAELLRNNGSSYIHSYGPAGLATVSFRGLNAHHTAIIWNGFNLQSIMNGQLDMNLIPVFLLENVTLQHGGAGALYGSGAVGGAIHLNKKPNAINGIHSSLFTGLGSYGQFQLGQSITFRKSNFVSTSKYFYHSADNDYAFQNYMKAKKPRETMVNAKLEQINFMQQNQWNFSRSGSISLDIWLQESKRQIPTAITARPSKATQNDNAIRTSLEYQGDFGRTLLWLRTGYFWDQNIYKDPDIELVSNNPTQTSISEAEIRHSLSDAFAINGGMHLEYYAATTDNYPENLNQMRYSFFGSIRYSAPIAHLNAIGNIRYSLIEGEKIPVIPSLAIEYGLSPATIIKANFGKNYRLPTFNDLYWIPYGNPDLKPESGWSQELGIETSLSGIGTTISTTIYNSNLTDFIKWQPDHIGIFHPVNLNKVWSRGAETQIKSTVKVADLNLNVTGKYMWTLSTQEGTEGKHLQLMYIPKHQAHISFSIVRQADFIKYHHNLVGKRFKTTDNNPDETLPVHHTGDVVVSKQLSIQNFKFFLQGKINNVWNAYYESYAYYPMPGRNFHLSVSLEY